MGVLLGNKLFSRVTELTGLPEGMIREELAFLLEKRGVCSDSLTLEDLREVLADYLKAVDGQIDGESSGGTDSKDRADRLADGGFVLSSKDLEIPPQ